VMQAIKGEKTMKKYVWVTLLSFVLVVAGLHPTVALAQSDEGEEEDKTTDPDTFISPEARQTLPSPPVTTRLETLVESISVTQDAELSTNSNTFIDIPGARVIVVVPAGRQRGFHVTLSGTCAIDGGRGVFIEEDVVVRVLVDGVQIRPGPTTMCEDASPDDISIPEGGHSLHWVSSIVGPGTYTIKAQWRTDEGALGFLRDFHFTVRVHESTRIIE
jgi:hypothetical protein